MTEIEINPEPQSEFDPIHPRHEPILRDTVYEKLKYDAWLDSLSKEERELVLKRQSEIVARILGVKK